MKLKLSDATPWPLLLGAKFLQVHPVGTIFAILLALPGQVALIVSFLLPLKIVMLMGSDGVPRFIPEIVADVDKKALIGALASLSVAAFLFHQLTNKAIDKIARSGVIRIQKRHQKLHLFEGQEELARNAYTRYIDSIASINFIILGVAVLFIIYQEVAFTLLLYVSTVTIGAMLLYKRKGLDAKKLAKMLPPKLPLLSGTGFLVIFSAVLLDYIFFSVPQSFIILLISIILSRQLLVRSSSLTKNLFFFRLQKDRLKAFLFHKSVFTPEQNTGDSEIFDFLNPETPLHKQLQHLLQSVFNSKDEGTQAKLAWRDTGLSGITILSARFQEPKAEYLIKIFNINKKNEANLEATLLNDASGQLPCPEFLADSMIGQHPIHVFDITGYSFTKTDLDSNAKDVLTQALSVVPIPPKLRSRYLRSHRMLWDRLSESEIHALKAVSNNTDDIETCLTHINQLKEKLKKLPLCLTNPQLGNDRLYVTNPAGNIEFLHWGRWQIEPYGASFSKELIDNYKAAPTSYPLSANQPQSSGLDQSPSPILAYLVYQLLLRIRQRFYGKAINTLRELNKRLSET
ncbi:hypothetical protein [Marinobacter mobilis]|uniref:Uncharacterized protein n=1 Tax=Marinobacter mobilis TaxID=488533 RepID=A0A1H3DB87_9GAMM|nr:hypothetical protein [Marinobacter mobilis]SDX63665.1 hypothetical protein SAMN04487960_11218 [Marinobacter mobilis]